MTRTFSRSLYMSVGIVWFLFTDPTVRSRERAVASRKLPPELRGEREKGAGRGQAKLYLICRALRRSPEVANRGIICGTSSPNPLRRSHLAEGSTIGCAEEHRGKP